MGTERTYAGEYIRALLKGGPPNGAPRDAFGDYRDLVETLHIAYDAGQTVKVREAWDDHIRRHPEDVELVAGDHTEIDGWQVYTLADAYQPRPPMLYVVEGLFSLPSLSIVYGAPGTLKSLLLADMAICVVAGHSWLPPLPHASGPPKSTQQVPVLWVDFDHGIRRTHERFEALARARQLPTSAPLSYVSMPWPWLDAGHPDTMKALERCSAAHGAKLVIIDNLSAVKGKADENSAEMGTVMANFRRLVEATGVAGILIHHQRKDSGNKTRAGDRLRGHSSIEAAIDLALLVERAPQAACVTVQSTKVRGVDVPPFGAMFSYEQQPGTTELARARFFGMAVDDKVSERAIEQVIIDIVTAHPRINQQTLKQLAKEVSPAVSMHRIGGVVARLEQQQKLRTKPGDRGAKLYEVA